MIRFGLEPAAIDASRTEAGALAAAQGMSALLARAAQGELLRDAELAACYLAEDVPTDALLGLATARRDHRTPLETFSPLYMTNECDAECLMCGMRGTNTALVRETADEDTVAAQLGILRRRGMRGVALLTGEYRLGRRRSRVLARVAQALRTALGLGFRHVLINVGSLEVDDYDVLLEGLPRATGGAVQPHVTMCTFQETYSPSAYTRFMGATPTNPRADFLRRLTNFDRAADAGMRSVNPGVLLGLNPDVAWELLALLGHIDHLLARGLRVYVSLPRLRRASGAPAARGVSDDQLVRLVAVLALGRPLAKIVISTREAPAIQRRLIPVIGVLTPGSPGVAPYTETGAAFDVEASQFEVLDHRPIEDILGEYTAAGVTFECWEPTRSAGAA